MFLVVCYYAFVGLKLADISMLYQSGYEYTNINESSIKSLIVWAIGIAIIAIGLIYFALKNEENI